MSPDPNDSPRSGSTLSRESTPVHSRTPTPMRWEGPNHIKLDPRLVSWITHGRLSPSMTLDPVESLEESIALQFAVEQNMKFYVKERELSVEKKERHDEIDADDFDDFDGDEEDGDDEGYGLSAENTLKQEFYLIIKEINEKPLLVRSPPIVKSPLPLTEQKVQKVWSG